MRPGVVITRAIADFERTSPFDVKPQKRESPNALFADAGVGSCPRCRVKICGWADGTSVNRGIFARKSSRIKKQRLRGGGAYSPNEKSTPREWIKLPDHGRNGICA